jgi:hypothetical protein
MVTTNVWDVTVFHGQVTTMKERQFGEIGLPHSSITQANKLIYAAFVVAITLAPAAMVCLILLLVMTIVVCAMETTAALHRRWNAGTSA